MTALICLGRSPRIFEISACTSNPVAAVEPLAAFGAFGAVPGFVAAVNAAMSGFGIVSLPRPAPKASLIFLPPAPATVAVVPKALIARSGSLPSAAPAPAIAFFIEDGRRETSHPNFSLTKLATDSTMVPIPPKAPLKLS